MTTRRPALAPSAASLLPAPTFAASGATTMKFADRQRASKTSLEMEAPKEKIGPLHGGTGSLLDVDPEDRELRVAR